MNATAEAGGKALARPVVLVVDDEPDLLELVSLTLSRMSLDTRTAADVATARRLLKSESFDLCLTDMRLPDGDGLDLVGWIQENASQCSGSRDHRSRQRGVGGTRAEAGGFRFRLEAPGSECAAQAGGHRHPSRQPRR